MNQVKHTKSEKSLFAYVRGEARLQLGEPWVGICRLW
jgi:hypothetical protein